MGVLDDSSNSSNNSSDSDSNSDSEGKSNPQEAKEDPDMDASSASAAGRMTPFASFKQKQQEKEAQLYLDFCEFAGLWLQPTGCVQKHMVVLFFREHYGNHKYKYTTAAEDVEIEDAFERWNVEEGPKAEVNEFGLFVGVQINAQYERQVKEQQWMDRRKTQIKLIIADSKRTGQKPPLEVLKEAMELGVIEVPKATLDSMRAVEGRPRRVSIAVPPSDEAPRKHKSKKSQRIV